MPDGVTGMVPFKFGIICVKIVASSVFEIVKFKEHVTPSKCY